MSRHLKPNKDGWINMGLDKQQEEHGQYCACDDCFDKPIKIHDEKQKARKQAIKAEEKRVAEVLARASRITPAVCQSVEQLISREMIEQERNLTHIVTIAVVDILAKLAADKSARRKETKEARAEATK